MNIRRLLNRPNQLQKINILLDEGVIYYKCNEIALAESKEQDEIQKFHNQRCPHCKESNRIVDRIAYVQGIGSNNGISRLGFGSTSGSIQITTEPVNHCNACGNEWTKYKKIDVSRTAILKVAFNYIALIYKNPEEKPLSKMENVIKVFDNCCAEAIYSLRKKNNSLLHSYTNEILTLSCIRKHFKSVYDPPSAEDLKRIEEEIERMKEKK